MDILIHNRYESDMHKMFIKFKRILASMYPNHITVHDDAKVIEIKGADLLLRFVYGRRVKYIMPPLYIYSDSVESRFYINCIVKSNEDSDTVDHLYSEEEILDTIVSGMLSQVRDDRDVKIVSKLYDRDVKIVSKLYYITKHHNYQLHVSRTPVLPISFDWFYSIDISVENLRNGDVYNQIIPIGYGIDYDKDFFESFEKCVVKELERI